MKTWLTCITLALLSLIQTAQAQTFKTERWHTKNGAQVVFYKATEVPMLDINVAFAAGSAYDGQHFGLSALTTQLLSQGTNLFNATQIAEQFADTGAQFNGNVSRDMVALQLKTLTNDDALKQAVKTFASIINKPAFRQDAFTREKIQQIAAITQIQESPNEVANLVFFNKLYQQHPYAHSVKGTIESVKAIKLGQVREFYSRFFVASNSVIVMVGAIDSEKAHLLAEQLTQNLPKGKAAAPIPKATQLTEGETINIDFPSSQTILRIGQVGIDHTVPDYFPLMIGNYILGGGALVSRLSNEVREKRGLTYGVDSQLMPMPGNGSFLISLSTQNKKATTALKVTEETLAGILTNGPNEDELLAAKQYMIGSFPLSLASNSNIAGMLLRIAFYHLPDDYLDTYTARISAVNVADIRKAFKNLIHTDKMLYVSVGSQQQKTS
jgi:zinc protease